MHLVDPQALADSLSGGEPIARGHDDAKAGLAKHRERLLRAGLHRIGHGKQLGQLAVYGQVHHAGPSRAQNFGLVRQTTGTVPAYAPKPSAVSQAVLIRKVSGKDFTARDASANTAVHSYAFGADAATTRVAWAVTPTTVTYAATEDVTQTDQFGAISTLTPVDGRITVELDGHALYLDGALSDMQ